MGIDYVNADGLVEHYGTRTPEGQITGEYEVDGGFTEVALDFDFASANGSIAGTVMGVTTADIALRSEFASIPAGATIVEAYLITSLPFVGDTVEVDIVTSAKVADAGSPVGGLISAAGAAVGTATGGAFTAPLAQASYIDVVPTLGAAGLTAGAGKVVVRYIA